MVTFERFQAILESELAKIPYQFKRGVNAFYADHRTIRQSNQLRGLYILGHYHLNKNFAGPAVTLYYGSFRKVFRKAPAKAIRREIARTLAHELLHHWEIQSGINDLGEEDSRKLAHWKEKMGLQTRTMAIYEVVKALVFFLSVLTALALASFLVSHGS